MKKKIISLCLVVALAATAIVGASLAYFTDSAAQTNTFTSGSVGLSLSEAVVKKDGAGNLVATATRTSGNQSYKLYPGMTVTKDPLITLDDDSEDSYVAAKITITGNLLDLYGADTATPKTYFNLDVTKFVSGGLINPGSTQSFNWNGLGMVYTDAAGNVYYQDASNGNKGASSVWVMYIFVKDIQEAKDTIQLFTTLTVDSDFDNAEMEKLNGASVKVEAFAVQTYGFTATTAADATDCFNAITTAFPGEFDF